MFPGGGGDDAGAQLVGWNLEHGVRRAAQLEGTDRVEVLELEVDLALVLELDEGRPQDPPGLAVAGRLDLGERDQKGTAVPRPSARALL
jgi:hypothetical protein